MYGFNTRGHVSANLEDYIPVFFLPIRKKEKYQISRPYQKSGEGFILICWRKSVTEKMNQRDD
jgi:hypothetical protein